MYRRPKKNNNYKTGRPSGFFTPKHDPAYRGLDYSDGFGNLGKHAKSVICNGAGAADSLSAQFIPNTMYGLDCKAAFDVHDYDYHVGQTMLNKVQADDRMLQNLFTLISRGAWVLRFLRRSRARKYYYAVKLCGKSAFFNKGGKS